MTTTPKRRLRWYQYSLRSLFVLTVLVAIAGSWFAVKRQQVERQRAAVKAIEEMGGVVVYEHQLASLRGVNWGPGGPPDGWIWDPNVQSPGPVWLRNLLGDDFFVKVLAAKPDPECGDGELSCVGVLSDLERVSLTGNHNVTDAGLEHLKGLTKLKCLWLQNTKVTPEGVKKLQEALPNCEIIR